ncbi:transglycosylase domain-containing protein [Halalkalibacter urbisdiaboli]|uniref:transglycosylase domain-containing protein n=1 Tax=Halalkalibacter urbisdiaboli TaxID=1960589 RepID=UPI000B448BBB|nr:transglycosylase domain-containing protein [Halalkalibacter urbisdiaboli]
MKNIFSHFIEKLRFFSEKLHEKKVFRRIGITYQVVWNLLLIFLVFGLMAVFFVGGTAAGYFASLVKDEPLRSSTEMKAEIYDYEETSQVFFADQVFLGELPSELERHQVALSDISKHVKNAIIATEDEHFFEHEGVVPKAIMRATFQEFANSSVQTGGSTLTQQLIKQQILSSEVSFDRKATEILLALRLEKFLDKDDILEAYLNVVPFGRNSSGRQIAGVQAAARGIFGVDAKELNIPQAAYIAGLPQSPFGYTPFTSSGDVKEHLDAGLNRMKTVLRRMYEGGYISEKEYENALAYDIRANLTEKTPSPIDEYPFLTYEVMRRATDILTEQNLKKDGINLNELEQDKRIETYNRYYENASSQLRRSGFRIYTTIDKDIYDSMQEAVTDDRLFGPMKEGEHEEVGAVLIENKTGAIKGFVGGRNEDGDKHYNHATQALRQNGSTMKPILAYAPAMEIGAVQPGIVVPDTYAQYSGGTEIRNFDRRHLGLLSVRESLARSRNVPAVRAFKKVPHDQARDTLLKLGFRLNDGEPYESAPLGSTDFNVTVEQNTNAYATFSNGGTFVKSYLIDRIETASGEIIYENKPQKVEVFSPQTSYLIIDMLRDVLKGGGTASTLPSRLKFSADWAGKTGTSSDVKDSWFVGSNPNVTLGVWIGYDTPKEINRTVGGLRYGPRTQQIWANIANAAYSRAPELMAPDQRFQMPNGIVSRSICSITGLLPSTVCQEAGLVKTDLFNAKFVPSKTDESLEHARYVTINQKKFLALESTPEEFTEKGVKISAENLGINDDELNEYLPESLKNIIPDVEAPNNGRTPSVVNGVRLNGQNLTWSKHPDNDIVGYRIYRAANESTDYQLLTSVKENDMTSYQVKGGSFSYYVTAVDTAGRESSASSSVEGDEWRSKPEPKPEKEPEEKQPEKKPDREEKPSPPNNRPEEDDADNSNDDSPADDENDGENNNTNQNRL